MTIAPAASAPEREDEREDGSVTLWVLYWALSALFIAELALSGEGLDTAKVGVLVGSTICAALGVGLLIRTLPRNAELARQPPRTGLQSIHPTLASPRRDH